MTRLQVNQLGMYQPAKTSGLKGQAHNQSTDATLQRYVRSLLYDHTSLHHCRLLLGGQATFA
jgi:hypothetical protein